MPSRVTHLNIHQPLSRLKECYNMFMDGLGGVGHKEANEANLLMHYNITSPKDKAPYHPD